MQRRTKIICTLGPASNSPEVIRNLIDAGMDIARLNFSHGTHDDHRRVYDLVREESEKAGKAIAIMQDLQGPKIRVGKIEDGGVLLHKDDEVTLTYRTEGPSDGSRVSISYPSLADDVEVGRSILIDDGNIELIVTAIEGEDVRTNVRVGGVLKTRKGVNLPHLENSTPSLTDKDLRDLDFGLNLGIDFVALSFVRTAQDVSDLISRVYSSGNRVGVIAKIEKPEAVSSIDQIIAEADGIMLLWMPGTPPGFDDDEKGGKLRRRDRARVQNSLMCLGFLSVIFFIAMLQLQSRRLDEEGGAARTDVRFIIRTHSESNTARTLLNPRGWGSLLMARAFVEQGSEFSSGLFS